MKCKVSKSIPSEITKINSEHGVQLTLEDNNGATLQSIGNTLQIDVYNERLTRWFYKKYKIFDNRIHYTIKYVGNATYLVPDNLYTTLIHFLWYCGEQDGRGNCINARIKYDNLNWVTIEHNMLKTTIHNQCIVKGQLLSLQSYDDTVNWPVLHVQKCTIASNMIITH